MLVYKFTFPNNKIYVGATTKTLEERIKGHKKSFRSNSKYNYPLYNAIRKYKFVNIKTEIIEDNINDINILNEREKFWIKELHATIKDKGYNITEGGLFGWKWTEEQKQKQSERLTGLLVGEKNPRYGDHRNFEEIHGKEKSLQLRKLYSEQRKGSLNNNCKYIYNLTSPNGVLYKQITDLKEFCLKFNLILK